MSAQVVKRGAEATITEGEWHGRSVIVKERVPKKYRIQSLDNMLRRTRTKREAALMAEARQCGIPTPVIFDVDVVSSTIVMENIRGELAKDVLQTGQERNAVAREIGVLVGRLHANNIVHGDLTTSNMLIKDEKIYFIDFGLGERSQEPEKKGVDLHLLKEALDSAHSEFLDLFGHVSAGYISEYDNGKEILAIVEDIEKRGRYS